MANQVIINAEVMTGVFLDDTSVGQLLAPPPMKPRIEANSRLEDGVRVVTPAGDHKMDARDFTLQLVIYGKTKDDFFNNFEALCAQLQTGKIDFTCLGKTFHCLYVSCNQFSQFMGGVGKVVLRLREYNPSERT